MYNIHYYSTAKGLQIVDQFIQQLAPKTRAKAIWVINRLRELGPDLTRPYADMVAGKIRELRIRFASDNIRILYFFFLGNNAVLLHGFRKKTSAIPIHEIYRAERYLTDFITRYEKGEIEL